MKTKKIPLRYLPKKLTLRDKKKQISMLKKSRKLYKKGQYYTRKNVKSFKSKTSNHVLVAKKMYNVTKIGATNDLAKCNTTQKTSNEIISGFSQIDPTPWFCSNVCPAVTDGFVAYRDASHITVAAALALAPKLDKVLQGKGIFS